ncbi:MAG: hypothetical protein AMXMBFR4_04140 [Candidatus Hydrogenedentota bacterium]
MNGRGRTRQIPDAVHLDPERVRYVVSNQFKAGVLQQVLDVPLAPREEVVQTKDFVAALEQAFAQMRADKACSPCDQIYVVNGGYSSSKRS